MPPYVPASLPSPVLASLRPSIPQTEGRKDARTQGWLCAQCGASYAPMVAECYRCNPQEEGVVITWLRRYPGRTRVTFTRECVSHDGN